MMPVVKVVSKDTESGYMIINTSDFDASIHKMYLEPDAAPAKADDAAPATKSTRRKAVTP